MGVVDLAAMLAAPTSSIVKLLFLKGVMVQVNSTLDSETVKAVALVSVLGPRWAGWAWGKAVALVSNCVLMSSGIESAGGGRGWGVVQVNSAVDNRCPRLACLLLPAGVWCGGAGQGSEQI